MRDMAGTVVFDPLLPWWLLAVVAGLMGLALLLAIWRRLSGWGLRLAAGAVLVAALANPSVQQEQRAPLSDILIAVVDRTSSQSVGDRGVQVDQALARLRAEVAAEKGLDLRVVEVADAPGDGGSPVMAALAEALAAEPRARVAGAVLLTDGRVHDLPLAPAMPAPLNVLLTGREQDWDRRLIIRDAPAFAILGEEVTLKLEVRDEGAVPAAQAGMAEISIAVDGGTAETYVIPTNQQYDLPVVLPHGGQNVLQFTVTADPSELTDRNNAAVVAMNGVRDRLQVLLVSGEPHAGERVWRNLLKSDPSVDLVHFTILRPPEKQDGVPVEELSLIAFPTRELFVEKIRDFDLIIFDRYRLRGILPTEYLENVRDFVRDGGTVLVASGPELGTADSLIRSPLAEIMPVETTSRVIEGGFKPALTDLGRRHPVTAGLEDLAPEGGWGRWFRQIEITARAGGQVVMAGADGRPLLVLSREGEGRMAVLASDQAWLWGRGFEGGGPQLELLRRLAHWMLKEPELEEETLTADPGEAAFTVTRRTLSDTPPGPVTVTRPDGTTEEVRLTQKRPGLHIADHPAPQLGLYRLAQGDLDTVVAIGPPAPREFEETLASGEGLQPIAAANRGGILRIEEGLPDLRAVSEGRAAAGRGWIGYTPRGAYATETIRIMPVLPGWAWALVILSLTLLAWLREGRRLT